jgi:transposase
MDKKLISDDLWEKIEPLLPKKPPEAIHKGGRPKVLSERAVLTGVIFVLKTGIPWESLPQEMGCGSGMTCWRCLRDLQAAGVWEKLLGVLQQGLYEAGKIDLSRVSIDASHVPAKKGASLRGRAL